jgi:hypothetical protein
MKLFTDDLHEGLMSYVLSLVYYVPKIVHTSPAKVTEPYVLVFGIYYVPNSVQSTQTYILCR